MLKKELLELIANGENSLVEFKRDDIRSEQLAKEIVAFANSYGGRVLVGVEDEGTPSGIQRADLERWIMDTVCARYVSPAIIPLYEEVLLEDNLRVAVITIPIGASKPYVVKHNDREEFYIRAGSISRIANRDQIIRMSASGGMLHVETLPVPRTSLRSLDMARLENYFRDILAEPSLPRSEGEWELRLLDMGFLAENSGHEKVCTIAGLVLFGINPRRYLKQAGLRIMVFDSDDKEYKALLDIVLDAPMVARVEVTDQRVSGLVDDGLVEKVAAALYPFISEESDTIDSGFRRPLKRFYPWNAIRELILNALAHRDWTRNTDIEICRYNDRLEVISPGALPNSMTVKKMVGGRRTPRNTIIMEVLRDYQYVDSRGMGIRTKVIPIMREFNGTEPEFEASEDFLKTTLYNNGPKSAPNEPNLDPNEPDIDHDDPNLDLNEPKKAQNEPNLDINEPKKAQNEPNLDTNEPKKTQNNPNLEPNEPNNDIEKIVLELIIANPKSSYTDMISATGKSRITIKRLLDSLKEKGIIERVGAKKGGKWVVK